MPIVVPHYDLVMVFAGSNILEGKHLSQREAID
jgi:hypothetical protein